MKLPLNSLVKHIKRSKKTALLIVAVSALTLIISTSISIWLTSYHNLRFPSLGTIQVIGVEAYGGNISVSQDGQQYIDWGTLYPGSVVNRSLYLKSKSNTPVTLNLSIPKITFKNSIGENVSNIPMTNEPLSITWNYTGAPLNPGDTIYVTLTLTASSDDSFIRFVVSNDVQNFYFDLIIKASPLH